MASVRLMVEFKVDGEPQGKGRPRFSRKIGRAYTPEKTATYESLIRSDFYRQNPNIRFDNGPVELTIRAYMSIPESKSKITKAMMRSGYERPTKKPDIDNIVKAVMDALNGAAWKDDKQVCELNVYKFYSDTPGLVVQITGDVESKV